MRQVVCPACAAANRLPPDKDAAVANCGRCGEKLFNGSPLEVSGETLKAHLRGDRGGALLLDVWAPWCGPCRAMAPQFAAAAAQLEPQVRLLKLNSDSEPQVAGELGISGIPTLVLYRDGQVLARQSGALSAKQIVAWTDRALGRAPSRAAQ